MINICIMEIDEEGVTYTGCGYDFMFESGGPKENGWKFCPNCGKTSVMHTEVCKVPGCNNPPPLVDGECTDCCH